MKKETLSLSICLTQYNENLSQLLVELINQLEKYPSTEIIIRDDCSTEFYNYPNFPHVRQNKNLTTLGRSANRNLLSKDAFGEWLLFIDGDSVIHLQYFIDHYMKKLENTDPRIIYVGGTTYKNKQSRHSLHRRYGISIETQYSDKQAQHHAFKSNNFLIHSSVFKQVKFDESIQTYGHEDSLFGYELTQKGFEITLINNPVENGNILNNREFVSRQEESMLGLVRLYMQGNAAFSKLEQFYRKNSSKSSIIYSFTFRFLLSIIATIFLAPLKTWLSLEKPLFLPPLFILQVYKILYFHQVLKSNEKQEQ